uniref:RPB3 subunit of eukaryotic RNA polymerase II n=1 Tax=Pithovirus LCPAC304 TaxID=2506594 RepID=A0A481Z8E2_9VIRU|nr:MAG: RPB3 subunit of eukaryotic RNA polymerase II [Pithovirus LCPAC304]
MKKQVRFVEIPVIQAGKRVRKRKTDETGGLFEVEGRPEVKFLVSGGGEECEFILEEVDFERGDASKLRRIIMSALEVMAIEIVEIVENETDLPDESIAQRLGLIPIRCDDVEDVPLITNEGRAEEEIRSGIPFSIDVDYPESTKGPRTKNVTESDIVISDKRCKTLTSGTPIFKLRPGQHFELRGLIQKGTGKMHAKWQPTTTVIFKHDEVQKRYTLSMETHGSLTCREIITRALEILREEDED